MNLPDLQGTVSYQNFFVYTACDSEYFKEFGKSFITSIQKHNQIGIHLHLFNPSNDQLEYCQQHLVQVTWEQVALENFKPAANKWSHAPVNETEKSQLDRTLTAMNKGQDGSVLDRMQKTYFACARFIRLAQIYQNSTVLAVDIDAVVRKPIPVLDADHDFYIHYISGKKARYLAGGLWLNPTAGTKQFLNEYATQLQQYFDRDHVYWGLDQDLLDPLVPKFNHGQLPISYIDWNMNPESIIWTAKGLRKHLSTFVNEKQKYSA